MSDLIDHTATGKGEVGAVTFDEATRERFLALVSVGAGCWRWVGYRDRHGYGHFSTGKNSPRAHRVAYEMEIGPIPKGLFVCHHCDTRDCVRPSHLFIGNHSDNMRDMIAKGRNVQFKGEKHSMAKLTVKQVLAIRSDKRSERTLAPLYGISPAQIGAIKRRKKWAHL